MDVTDVLRRLVRLRLAVAAVLVIAVAAAAVAYLSADGSQQSRAVVVVVPPKVANVAGGDNPLLSLDNNLAQLAVVLQGTLGSASVSRALERRGATAEFTVTTVTGDNPSFSQLTPQLIFTVTGADATVTRRTAAALVDQSGVALTALQDRAGVPSGSRAAVVEVSAPTTPVAVAGGGLRSAGTLGLGIVVLGLVLVLALDAVRRRRGESGPTAAKTRGRRRFRPGSGVAGRTANSRPSRPLLAPATARVATTAKAAVPLQKTTVTKAPTQKAPAKKAPAKKVATSSAPAGHAAGGTSTTKTAATKTAAKKTATVTPAEQAPLAQTDPADVTPTRPPADRTSGSRDSASRKTAGRPGGRSSRQSRARRARG